jgi:hypothetical protein
VTPERTEGSAHAWHVGLALLSLAAAAIHFAVMGEHFDLHVAHGLFFAVVAWAQALWAVGLLIVARRALLVAGLAGNLAVVVTWALSRTVGVPIGPEPWTPEAVGTADLVSTVVELVIVAGCGLELARRPASTEERRVRRVPALGLVLSLAVLTSATIATGAGHSHGGGEAADHGHAADALAEEANGHTHELVGTGEVDLRQIDAVRAAMRRYRDVRVAFDEGWKSEHADWPEIGSHFYRNGDWDGSFPTRPGIDLEDPEFLMYSRLLTGRWKLVAVAYVVDQARYPEPPTELSGALYHEHVWNCIDDGEELEEEDWGVISEEECAIMGGVWSPGGVWMTHVWLIDNPNGVFAETNPALVAA